MQDRVDLGESYTIEPETIDPTGIYIKAELIPLKPTDDLAKWNAGQIANQVGLPKEYILEDAGIEDPQEALKVWESEKIDDQLFEEWRLERMNEIEEAAREKQLEQQERAKAMAEEQAAAAGGGPGMDTSQGGTPSIQANPPETQLREQVQGRTRTGEPLA